MNNFIVDTTDTYYLNKIYSDIDMLTIKYKHILYHFLPKRLWKLTAKYIKMLNIMLL